MNSVLRNTPIIRPGFIPFDECRATRIYHRNLPHWRQEGVTYFVTFREADSVPEAIRQKWEEEKGLWLKARDIHYDGDKGQWRGAFERLPSDQQSRFHKYFNRQIQSCLDRGLGRCSLRDPACASIVRAKLLAEDGTRHHAGDFIIMPNHVHLLLTPLPGEELEMILKQVKGASAVDCNRYLGRAGKFWQADSYDHIVRSTEQLRQYRQYIADNPKNAGIAVSATASYVAAWMDDWLKL